jgi:hypothetical protein
MSVFQPGLWPRCHDVALPVADDQIVREMQRRGHFPYPTESRVYAGPDALPELAWYEDIISRVAMNWRFVGMISRTMSGLIGIPRSSVQRRA